MDSNQNKLSPSRFAFYVRVSEQEYKRIMKMAAATRKSAQELLKDGLLSRMDLEKPIYLFTPEQAAQFGAELKRQGNNINQIAKQINSGLMRGWSQALSGIHRGYLELNHRLAVNRANS